MQMLGRSAFAPGFRVATTTTTRNARRLHASAPVASAALSPHKLQRLSSIGLVALVPAALLAEPSSLVYPLDLALGVLLPVHAHLGMRDVIRDYVPRPELAQYVLWAVTVLTVLGLTKLNFNGAGLSASAKQLWKDTTKATKD